MRYSSALDVLKAHWDFKLPVDAKAIAQKMGIEVRPAEPGSRESGHYVYRDGAPLITYNPSETTVRQRFTIAHEIGHHVNGDIDAPRDTDRQMSASVRDPREVAANRFAAALLMPAALVKHMIFEEKVTDLKRLANAFGVSTAAMEYRLRNIGIL
ncbi:ImmA/IrrE family metallo-endopeptidase [Pseudomonas sp. URMO17WK12:I11]|uniref:ImmA/IrrE family metallo-endopeptidase n=1 Tax=Pseudomonas sp. URMO17WK12:I11 TaxID=1283291 RepID=UPI0011A0F337|nr:ImmA/IrrE family metallo-endopeptidase [Pseudomonas sp. URMO17WK12:I11]